MLRNVEFCFPKIWLISLSICNIYSSPPLRLKLSLRLTKKKGQTSLIKLILFNLAYHAQVYRMQRPAL